MTQGWLLSSLLHLGIGVLIYVGLPEFGRLPPASDVPVTVELVSQAPDDGAPAAAPAATAPEPPREAARPAPQPAEPQPDPEPEVAEPEPPAPPPEPEPQMAEPEPEPAPEPEAVEPKPAPEVAKTPPPPEPEPEAEPAPEPEVVEPEPEPEPEPEEVEVAARPPEITPAPERPTPPPRPALKPRTTIPAVARNQPEPEADPAEDDFDANLRSIISQMEQLQAEQERDGKGRAREGIAGASATRRPAGTASLFQAEKEAVVRQIGNQWSIPEGLVGVDEMQVTLRIEVNPDRTVRSVQTIDEGNYRRDPRFEALARSAEAAVRLASPLDLPQGKYGAWREMQLTFSPLVANRG